MTTENKSGKVEAKKVVTVTKKASTANSTKSAPTATGVKKQIKPANSSNFEYVNEYAQPLKDPAVKAPAATTGKKMPDPKVVIAIAEKKAKATIETAAKKAKVIVTTAEKKAKTIVVTAEKKAKVIVTTAEKKAKAAAPKKATAPAAKKPTASAAKKPAAPKKPVAPKA